MPWESLRRQAVLPLVVGRRDKHAVRSAVRGRRPSKHCPNMSQRATTSVYLTQHLNDSITAKLGAV